MKALNWVHKWDVICIRKIFNANIYNQILPVSRWVSKSGDGWIYIVTGLSFLIFSQSQQPYFQTLALGFAIERLVYYVLKNSLKRNRPFRIINIPHHVEPSDAFSFPSGHTSSAFLFALITAAFYPLLLMPLVFWASLIGTSRVILGVHFPTDILVGALLGYLTSEITISWMKIL